MSSDEPASPSDQGNPSKKQDKNVPVSVHVGRDANGDIAIGSGNIFNRIKNYNFLASSIVLGIVLLVLVGLGYREVQRGKYNLDPMSGDLNVAVVRFTDWTDGKCGTSRDTGLLLANAFHTRLENDPSMKEFYKNSSILMELRAPGDLYQVTGRDETELVRNVEELAERINAHIVVYGVLSCTPLTRSAAYQLMFYVAPSSFSDAQELIGEFAFRADVLHGEINSGTEFLELNKSLQQKIEIMSILVKAIGSFWGEDYSRSLEYLSAALDSTLWNTEGGQEVVHILAGNCESRYAHRLLVTGREEESVAAIERARSHYVTADELTQAAGWGKYGRSYIGLAGVESFYTLKKSLLSNQHDDIDFAALEREQAMLDKAEQAGYQPVTSDIPQKVAFYRAGIGLLLYELGKDRQHLSNTRSNYQFVIDSFTGGNIRVRELAAHSYAGLAVIARLDKDVKAAIDHYQKAVEITRVPSLQAQYLLQIGNTYYSSHELQKALEYYRETLSRKKDLENRIPESTILELERRVKEIEKELANQQT